MASTAIRDQFKVFDYLAKYRFKKLVLCNDSDSGLRLIIAIHSTALGPACGGLRMWHYDNEYAAMLDAMRLARGMTYKYAAAGVNLGGGKAVIMGNPKTDKSEELFRAVGRMIDQQGGDYMTGEDVGTTLADMETIYSETDHVITLPEHAGGAGDISPATALGSIEAMRACVNKVWGSRELKGRSVAVQGLGTVGMKAAQMLADAGATLTVTDVDVEKVADAVAHFNAHAVEPDAIYSQDVDVFAPYALGGVINDETIPQLKAKVVAGSANNILAEDRHAEELEQRDITYAVDFIANSGGTILDTDRFRKGGLQRERAMNNVRKIYQRTQEVFEIARQQNVTCQRAAEILAESRIERLSKVRLLDRPGTA